MIHNLTLTFSTSHRILCPSCFTVLDSRWVWVHDNWLFCKQCVSIVDESMMEQLIHVLGTKLRSRHVLTHRNLFAFAPHAKPHKSLLMLADDNDPFWMPK